jgi:hypothetical protein
MDCCVLFFSSKCYGNHSGKIKIKVSGFEYKLKDAVRHPLLFRLALHPLIINSKMIFDKQNGYPGFKFIMLVLKGMAINIFLTTKEVALKMYLPGAWKIICNFLFHIRKF